MVLSRDRAVAALDRPTSPPRPHPQLAGSAELSIRPASRSRRKSSRGHSTYPQLTIRWGGGLADSAGTAGADNGDTGGLLQFVAMGVSLVNRTEVRTSQTVAQAFGPAAAARPAAPLPNTANRPTPGAGHRVLAHNRLWPPCDCRLVCGGSSSGLSA